MKMIHAKSLLDGVRRVQNEDDWDDLSLNHQQQEAITAPPLSRIESLHNTAEPAAAAAAASSLDDYLRKYPSVSDFVLSIPSRKECNQEFPLPAEMPSDNEQKNEEESCDDSIVSDITEMTYRAELMKEAINIEYQKFRKQHVEANPKEIATMFARTMSCPNIQASVNSFVNNESAKKKAEKRRSDLEGISEEDEPSCDPTMQMRVDELFVEFGVRPSRSIPQELLDESTTRERPSNEQRIVPDHHLDSVIQLKLQLAQKQAAYDELSSQYFAMMLQKSEQQKLLAENSSLKRENERLRAQLDQAGISSAAPNLMKLSSFSLSSGSSTSKSKLSLSFTQGFTRRNDATSPQLPQDSTHSFSSMMNGWRNRAA